MIFILYTAVVCFVFSCVLCCVFAVLIFSSSLFCWCCSCYWCWSLLSVSPWNLFPVPVDCCVVVAYWKLKFVCVVVTFPAYGGVTLCSSPFPQKIVKIENSILTLKFFCFDSKLLLPAEWLYMVLHLKTG